MFEYTIVKLGDIELNKLEEILNEFGKGNWKVVCSVKCNHYWNNSNEFGHSQGCEEQSGLLLIREKSV